jgi:carnosine N-methyltransferase
MADDIINIEEEQIHFSNVITAFKQYAQYSVCSQRVFVSSRRSPVCFTQLTANNRRRKDLYTLPHADQELLDKLGYKQKLSDVDNAILANADFLNEIIENPEIFGHDLGQPNEGVDDGDEIDQDDNLTDHSSNHSHGWLSPLLAVCQI